jgi:hypothetical protein
MFMFVSEFDFGRVEEIDDFGSESFSQKYFLKKPNFVKPLKSTSSSVLPEDQVVAKVFAKRSVALPGNLVVM